MITDEEIAVIIQAGEIDLDQFHRFKRKNVRGVNPYRDLADMLRCHYHTGARTGELARIQISINVLQPIPQIRHHN